VRRRGIGPVAALGAVLLAVALGGCGGSGSDASTGTSVQASAEPEASGGKASGGGSAEGAGKSGGGHGGGAGSAGSGTKVKTAPLKVSGGGSDQYRVQGGDNSIQEFGEESDEAELEEAAAVLHGYLVARAEEDWQAACAKLAKSVKEQLQELAARSESLKGRGCAAILETLTPPLPPTTRRESTIVDAGSLRHEGERAFLIYRGAGGASYAVLMAPEGGGWRVGSLGATPLS